jgi:rhodanese-related sulfurtransferase
MSTDGGAIAAALAAARDRLERVDPADLATEMAAGALVVDLRPAGDRAAHGELPGAVVVERIHLEWRVDPTSPDRLPEATPDRRIVLFCNDGYASSLAAAGLLDLGVARATDLVGGYRAWRALQRPSAH